MAAALVLGVIAWPVMTACSSDGGDATGSSASTTLGAGASGAEGSTSGAGAGSGGDTNPDLPADVTEGAAANRMIGWTGLDDVAFMSDADWDLWRERGFGGWLAGPDYLRGFGGASDWKGSSALGETGEEWQWQKWLESNDVQPGGYASAAHAHDMKVYFALHLQDYFAPDGGFVYGDILWDADYRDQMVTALGNWAAGARFLGLDGLSFDVEPYANRTWSWDYPGNTHTQAETKAAAFAWGVECGHALVDNFPGYDLYIYGAYHPEAWNALVQKIVNGAPDDVYSGELYLDFLDGIHSVGGYGEVRHIDATFYKTSHLNGSSFDTGNKYNAERWFAWMSNNYASWQTVAPKMNVSPFIWIDEDIALEGPFTADRGEPYVADQLANFRKWGMAGEFADFMYHGFDYRVDDAGNPDPAGAHNGYVYAGANPPGGHVPGMQAAAQPGTVDTTAPTLDDVELTRDGDTVHITCRAAHPLAIRNVHAYVHPSPDVRVHAAMTWNENGGAYDSNYDASYQACSLDITAPRGSFIVLTAVSIKGQTHSVILGV